MAAGGSLLLDVTRDATEQLADVTRLGAVALTHAHRDAAGGIAALARWWRGRGLGPLPLYACEEAIAVVRERHRRLDHVRPIPVGPGERVALEGLTLSAVEVPHALDRRFRTYAWRVDGAMWQRQLFAHLTVDPELPGLCRWPIERILLTQIGRTAPPHEHLERAVGALCAKASPAWDGLVVDLA